MKIAQSTISLQSQHLSMAEHSQQETLRAWVGERRPAAPGVVLSLSATAQATLQQARAQRPVQLPTPQLQSLASDPSAAVADAEDPLSMDPRMQLLMQIIEALTGRAVRVFDARSLHSSSGAQAPASVRAAAPSGQTQQAPPPVGWGLEYTRTESVHEVEQTRVSAQGVVRTADGQEIRFDLQIDMNRAYSQQTQLSVRAGDAQRTDPLVINFNGTAAQLTDTRFSFDLNTDGQPVQIATLAAGSGFLALDKNQDGRINNGSELFGPSSGNGFADLARYDGDGNQWIDANDPIFSQLRVWERDAQGMDQLRTLAECGVGAISLGQVASPFSLKDASNQSLGQVRSTGVFLYESGQVGSVQQVDL